ncbi:MAG: hypothetical protein Q8N77_03960 [Nanoarchaeota archaeon]|nr:hypothetical protein [Nanoarchaeota archaeon]
MKRLEQLLEQEPVTRMEGFLILKSISTPPPTSPSPEPGPSAPFSLSAYADSLNKQFGVPSPSTKPRAPSSLATAENFDACEIIQSINNSYKPPADEGLTGYANSLNQQFNVPSPSIKPLTSHTPTLENFDCKQIIDSIKNPICSSSSSNPFNISSSPIKTSYTPVYDSPEFTTPEPLAPKILQIDLKPEKKLYDSFKKDHTIKIYGLKSPEPIYNLFKEDEFPKVYKHVAEGLRLGKEAVKIITFTNPLKNENDVSPSFSPYKNELRFPAIKPKTIPFDKMSKKDYNKMLNNAFLPHELGHAKISEEYDKYYPAINMDKPELLGFQEPLADAFAFDSIKDTPQLFNTKIARIEFEDRWVTPDKDTNCSRAMQNYDNFITSKEEASFIPGKQTTIKLLGEPLLEQKYDLTLKSALDLRYGNDTHKDTVYENVNNLSNFYQEQAIKLVELSKRNTLLSDFKAKRILSSVEKQTFKFMEDL